MLFLGKITFTLFLYLFATVILFLSSQITSQVKFQNIKSGTGIQKDTKGKPSNNFFQRGLIASLKGGHHSFSNTFKDGEYPSGIGLDASIEFGFGSGWSIATNFDYWKKNNVDAQGLYFENIKKDFNAFGYNFQVKKRFNFNQFNKFVFFYLVTGIGGGSYTISEKYPLNYVRDRLDQTYFNLNFTIAIDTKVYKAFFLTLEYSLYSLINASSTESRSFAISNFKFGPTFYINFTN